METTTHKGHVFYHILKPSALFPNNDRLPVIMYKAAWDLPFLRAAAFVKKQFAKHHWLNAWKDGIFDYHHYHSTAHEVLAAIKGSIELQLGGDKGLVLSFEKGDVIVIPAGVAHKNLTPERTSFACVGAYPEGQFYNMNYGIEGERPLADQLIRQVPLPSMDPVYGHRGPLVERWLKK